MRSTLMIFCLALLVAGCDGGDNNAAGGNECNGTDKTVAVKPRAPSAEDKRRAKELFEEAQQAASAARDRTRAAELFFKAVELNPSYKEAHANLGRVLHELGRYTEAKDHHLRAAELEPDASARQFLRQAAADDCMAMAAKAMKIGEYKLAEEHIFDAHKLVPEYYSSLLALGNALYHQERYEEAEDAYWRAGEMASGKPRHEALFEVGQCRYARDDYESAEEVFSTMIAEDYTGQDVYAWRGYCRVALKDVEGALSDFGQAQRYASSDEKAREFAQVEGKLMRARPSDD